MSYTMTITNDGGFDDVVDQVTTALQHEGFGILCDIDVQATFEEKLDAEFRQYRILGACNPTLAHEALNEELELGTLLPCNVIVYETDAGAVMVSFVDPKQLLSIVDNPALNEIAAEVDDRFARVAETVESGAQ